MFGYVGRAIRARLAAAGKVAEQGQVQFPILKPAPPPPHDLSTSAGQKKPLEIGHPIG